MARKRILLSARDPGGAGNMVALARYFRQEAMFDVHVAASGVGYTMLRTAEERPEHFIFSHDRDHLQTEENQSSLLSEAKKLLGRIKPDAVITSLSSFGVGIDEALLATANVPTFAVQEFWGDVNLGLGIPANMYFVLDDYAVELSEKRWGVKAVAVGAPKYTLYKEIDIMRMWKLGRSYIGVGPGDKVVGWFGQSPQIPGHKNVFYCFIKALADFPRKPKLLLREHPKFTESKLNHLNDAKKMGLEVFDATGKGEVERWLVACDLVVTPFSACGLDHAYLSAYSPIPIGSVLYLMTNEEIRKYSQEVCGMVSMPIVSKGIGRLLTDSYCITEALFSQLKSQTVQSYFMKSKQLASGYPLIRIYDYVLAKCRKTNN